MDNSGVCIEKLSSNLPGRHETTMVSGRVSLVSHGVCGFPSNAVPREPAFCISQAGIFSFYLDLSFPNYPLRDSRQIPDSLRAHWGWKELSCQGAGSRSAVTVLSFPITPCVRASFPENPWGHVPGTPGFHQSLSVLGPVCKFQEGTVPSSQPW